MDAVVRFAGSDVDRAVYFHDDERVLLELTPRVEHYEVVAAETQSRFGEAPGKETEMNSPQTGHGREATGRVAAATTGGTVEVATPISDSVSGDRWVFRIGGWAAIAGAILGLIGNLIHPVTPMDDPEGVARVIAESEIWVPSTSRSSSSSLTGSPLRNLRRNGRRPLPTSRRRR
jgi:hypothetical protein